MNDHDDYSSDDDSFVSLRNVNSHTKNLSSEYFVDDPLWSLQWDSQTHLWIGTEDAEEWKIPVIPHQDDWEKTGEYIGNNKTMKTLTFGELDGVTEENLVALCEGGLCRNKSIKEFSIELPRARQRSRFDVDFQEDCDDFLVGRGFLALSSYFEKTSSLEEMSLVHCKAAVDCDDFARHLAGALSKFSSLKSFESHLNPKMAHKVLASLAGHTGLETIQLRSDHVLGKRAYAALSALLQGQKLKLSSVGLELREDYDNMFVRNVTGMLDDNGIAAFASGLCGRNAVKELNLVGNQNITNRGWSAFAIALKSSRSVLEQLYMPLNALRDGGAMLIANALSQNKALKDINLSSCWDITSRGWKAFCAVFESEDSALKTMTLWDCRIAEDVHIAWANSLANNKKLKRLSMKSDTGYWTETARSAFRDILCNTSTIMDAFLSNHTLDFVATECTRFRLRDDALDTLLTINKSNSAFDAAREKIIMHHSREVVQIFKEMEFGFLPDALAWMGKRVGGEACPDEGNDEGNDEGSKFSSGSSMLYDFLRAMAGLFEGMNAGGARKRKRE